MALRITTIELAGRNGTATLPRDGNRIHIDGPGRSRSVDALDAVGLFAAGRPLAAELDGPASGSEALYRCRGALLTLACQPGRCDVSSYSKGSSLTWLVPPAEQPCPWRS
jgi:hypothetical protein